MADSAVGSKISLISKSEIRYEGFLHFINADENTVGLKNVRMFGTEGRRNGVGEVPAGEQLYEFIIFRGNDIRDLTVYEDAKSNLPQDPAIVNAKASDMKVSDDPKHNNNNNRHHQQQQQHQQHGGNRHQQQQRDEPQQRRGNAGGWNVNDSSHPANRGNNNNNNRQQNNNNQQQQQGGRGGNNNSNYKGGNNNNNYKGNNDRNNDDRMDRHHQGGGRGGRGGYQGNNNNNNQGGRGRGNNNNNNNQGGSRHHGGGGNHHQGGGGAPRNNNRETGTGREFTTAADPSKARAELGGDFDFEKARLDFEKKREEFKKEKEASGETKTYDKTGFFDSISCDTTERLQRGGGRRPNFREEREKQNQVDAQTFGNEAIGHRNAGFRRGGPRRFNNNNNKF